MSSRSLDERLQKLEQLKKRKNESEKKNREELFKEHRKQAVGEGKLRAMELKQEKAMEELDKLESKEKGEDWDRKKGWDYSIEDNEKWDKKQELKNQNKNNGGFVNYAQLAEQSYKKEIDSLEVNKEEYLRQKAKLQKKRIRSAEDGKDDEGDQSDLDEVDYNDKPSKAAIDRLVSNMRGSDTRKLRRRKDYEETDTYSKYFRCIFFFLRGSSFTNTQTVNDKNKQFNEKLDRHYDGYLK